MSESKQEKLFCICGGQGGGDVKFVRMRIAGKPMQYSAKFIPLCATCRKAELGRWKYAMAFSTTEYLKGTKT